VYVFVCDIHVHVCLRVCLSVCGVRDGARVCVRVCTCVVYGYVQVFKCALHVLKSVRWT